MLIKHISAGNQIFVMVDSDCDGYTSSALLLNYLNKVFPYNTQANIAYALHEGKQHGIKEEAIPKGTKLIIAPDSSSNEFSLHQRLREYGIDILVLDHHEAHWQSEDACVINNQLCDYPTKSLSGVGIVYKFCSYLDSLLGTNYAEDLVDLAALGIIADVMPLTDYETKRIIDKGIANIKNPFFKGMTIKNAFSLGSEITPFGIAWYIAPYINAITRSGTMEEKLLTFEAMLEYKAYEEIPSTKRGCKGQFETRVEQAVRTCGNVKNRQGKITDTDMDTINHLISQYGLLDHRIILVQLDRSHKTSLAGLIANKLMGEYQRPTLILTQTEQAGEKWWEGSFRAPKALDFKDFCIESKLVEYAEGHQQAGGVGIKDCNIEAFRLYCEEHLKDIDLTPNYKVDKIYNGKSLVEETDDFYSLMSYGNIWGQGVEEPDLAMESLVITKDNIILMKGTTLKITCGDISFIKFKSNEQEYEALYPNDGVTMINVIFNCKKNEWGGKVTPQLIIKDYEITNRMEYYF